MRFEFDPATCATNLAKHGIVEAQQLWDDPRLCVFLAPAQGEVRCLGVGMIDGRRWSAVFTPRSGWIGLISARRSRKLEVQRYEGG